MKRGFTLLELLVVIVIVGLMATLAAPRYFGKIEDTKVQVARTQIEMLDKALTQYRLDIGTLPPASTGLRALVVQPAGLEGWEGPYVKNVPPDPWDQPYVLRVPGTDGRDFEIVSFGGDGAFGGTGAAADIDNIH